MSQRRIMRVAKRFRFYILKDGSSDYQESQRLVDDGLGTLSFVTGETGQRKFELSGAGQTYFDRPEGIK